MDIPEVDTGPANTINCSADNKSIHARCGTAEGRANFENNNTGDEEIFEIKVGVQGCSLMRS